MIRRQVLVVSIWLWPLLSAAPPQQLQVATITPIVAINNAVFNEASNVNRINGGASGLHLTSTTADEDLASRTTPITFPLQSLIPSRLGLVDGFPALSPNVQSTGIPLSSTTSQGSQLIHFDPVVTNPVAKSIFSTHSPNLTNPLDINYDYLDVLVVSNPATLRNNFTLNNSLNVTPNFFDFDYILDEILNTTDSSVTPKAPTSDILKSIQTTSNGNDFLVFSKLLDTMNNKPFVNTVPNPQVNTGVPFHNLTPSTSVGVPLSATAPATSNGNDFLVLSKLIDTMNNKPIVNAVSNPQVNTGVPFHNLTPSASVGVPLSATAPATASIADSSISSVAPTSDIPNSFLTSSTANDLQLIKKLLETMSRLPFINEVPNSPSNKGVPLPFPSPPTQTDVNVSPTAQSLSGDSKLGLPFSPSDPLVVNTGGVPLPSGAPLSTGVPLSSGVSLSSGLPLSSVDPLLSGVPLSSGVPLLSGSPPTLGVPLPSVTSGSPSSLGNFHDIPTFPSLGINENLVREMLEGRLQNPLGTTVFIVGQPQGDKATSPTKPKSAAVAPSGSGNKLSNPRAPAVISPNPPFGGTLQKSSPILGYPYGTPFSNPVVSPYHNYPTYESPYIHNPHYAGSPYRHYRIRVRRPVKEKSKGKGWDYYYKGFKNWFNKDDKKDSENIIIIQKQPHYSSYPTSGTYEKPHPYISSGSYGIPYSYQSPIYSQNHPFGRGALSGSAALSGSSVLGDPRFTSPLGLGSPLGFRSPLGGGVAFGRLGFPADNSDDIPDSLELLDAGSGGFGGGGSSGGLGASGGSGGGGSNGGLSGNGGSGGNVGIGGFSGNGGTGGLSGLNGGLSSSIGSGNSGGSGGSGGLGGSSGSGGSGSTQGFGVTLASVTGGRGGVGSGSVGSGGVGSGGAGSSGVASGGVGSRGVGVGSGGVGSSGVGSGGVTLADTTASGLGGVSTTGLSTDGLGQNTVRGGGSNSGSTPLNVDIIGSANLGTGSVGSLGTGSVSPVADIVGESSSGNIGTSVRDNVVFTPTGPITIGAVPSAFRFSPIQHHHTTSVIPTAFRESPIHHHHHGYYPAYKTTSEHVYVPVNRHKYKNGHHHDKGHYHKGYKGIHSGYGGYKGYRGYKGYKGPRTVYRTTQYAPSYRSPSYSRQPVISYGNPSYSTHAYRSPISHPSIVSHY